MKIVTNKHNKRFGATQTGQNHLRANRNTEIHELSDKKLIKVITKYEQKARGTEPRIRKIGRAIAESLTPPNAQRIAEEDSFADAKIADDLLARRGRRAKGIATNIVAQKPTPKRELAEVVSTYRAPTALPESGVFDQEQDNTEDGLVMSDGTDPEGLPR